MIKQVPVRRLILPSYVPLKLILSSYIKSKTVCVHQAAERDFGNFTGMARGNIYELAMIAKLL